MGNTATLVFAGDTSKLDQAFNKVGAGAKQVQTSVGETSSRFARFGEASDTLAGNAGKASGAFGALQSAVDLSHLKTDQHIASLTNENTAIDAQIGKLTDQKNALNEQLKAGTGNKNAITAQVAELDKQTAALNDQKKANADKILSDQKSEQSTQGITAALMGAQLATDALSGVTDLLSLTTNLSSLSKIKDTAVTIAHAAAQKAAAVASEIWAGAQWLLNLALDANPIGLIVLAIAALIAIVVIIATKTTWFQDIWAATWGAIKFAAEATWKWISGTLWPGIESVANAIGGAFTKIPGLISKAFSGLVNLITWPFRTAFNLVSDAWNNTIGRLSWTIPSWVPGLGGQGISAPKLPHFHTGGIVSGAMGSEVLAVLKAGEKVTSGNNSSDGGGTTVVLSSDGTRAGDAILAILKDAVSIRGGNAQLVIGNSRG